MKNLKKGFTIIELVIVIAVIAILAAVLIPTFSTVIDKANQSKALQEARSLYEDVLAIDLSDGVQDGKDAKSDTYSSKIDSIEGKTVTYTASGSSISFSYSSNGYTATFNGTDWTVEKSV